MSKIIKVLIFGLTVAPLTMGSHLAFAKEHGGHAKEHGGKEHGGDAPPGWSEGKKVGWEGASQPPGLTKKEAVKVEKKAKAKAKAKVKGKKSSK